MDRPIYYPVDVSRRTAYNVQKYKQTNQRIAFQDFGRSGHVDIWFDGDATQPTVTPQRQHLPLRDQSCLCASLPAIPLRDVPAAVTFPFSDTVMGETLKLQQKVKDFTTNLKQRKNHCNSRHFSAFSKMASDVKKLLDKMPDYQRASEEKINHVVETLPDGLMDLCKTYDELMSAGIVQLFNPAFSGGVVSCVKTGETLAQDHLVVHAEGPQLETLKIQRVKECGRLLQSQVVTKNKTEPIFQVSTSFHHDTLFVGTRHEHGVSVFSTQLESSCPMSEELTNLEKKTFSNGEAATFFSLSPYIAAEGLVVTDTGSVYIWTIGSFQKVLAEKKHHFPCNDPWRQVHYGSHPRHLIVTDRTAMEMMDHRSGYSKGTDLFSLPNKLLHPAERIMASRPHGYGSPYHLLATNYSFFLLDQRFPGCPVMQWHPDLLKPPQYISTTNITMDTMRTSSIALIASQQPAETMCYHFDYSSGTHLTSPFLPWRLSRISDVAHFNFTDGIQDSKLARQRLGASLAGIAVLEGENPESLITYQVDNYGEVFYQCYGNSDVNSFDKTCSWNFGTENNSVHPQIHQHMASWFSKLHADVLAISSTIERREATTVTMNDDLVSSDASTCSRCSGSIGLNSDSTGDDSSQEKGNMGDTCTEDLRQPSSNITDDKKLEKPLGDLSALDLIAPPLKTYTANNAHTKIHLVLAYPDDKVNLQELLQKRDEEREAVLKAYKEDKRPGVERRKERKRKRIRFESTQRQTTVVSISDPVHTTEHQIIEEILSQSRQQVPACPKEDRDSSVQMQLLQT